MCKEFSTGSAKMGCSASKLSEEEAVKLCSDRKNFIQRAVEQRTRFACGHIAYVESLRRVSLALRDYVDGEEHHDFFLGSCMTPPFAAVENLSPGIAGFYPKSLTPPENQLEKSTTSVLSPEIVGIHPKSLTQPEKQLEKISTGVMNYSKSGGEPLVSIEKLQESPETVRIESYYTTENYGMYDFCAEQYSPMNLSFFSSPYIRPNYQTPSPQASHWDSFWNPFLALDQYGYLPSDSFDQVETDDETVKLRQIREEEGIPELEEEGGETTEVLEQFKNMEIKDETSKIGLEPPTVIVDHVDAAEVNMETEKEHTAKEIDMIHSVKSQASETAEVSEAQNVELEVADEYAVVGKREDKETPGSTVHLKRRPISMKEVIIDVDCQFMRICDTAHEVSVMLEVSKVQQSSTSHELTAIRMLNPVALFRSVSLHSASSNFLQRSSTPKDDGYKRNNDYSEESGMVSGSHQSTLDRLYAWEKKLYEEVKSGERIRIEYEKRCMQLTELRKHDANGEDSLIVERTRAAIRDLRTRLQIYIHTVQYVSKRIELLRDEELHPQLMELIQRLARMWRTMADCHRIQKCNIDEAKLLLFSPSAAIGVPRSSQLVEPRPSPTAANLEAALRHWRCCLEAWVEAQRSYVRALAGWAVRCERPEQEAASGRFAQSPLSPSGAPPVFGICRRWSRLIDSVTEARVVEGVDFFAAGIGSVCAQQREGAADYGPPMAPEVASRVLCAGMSVSIGALAEFTGGLAEGYEALVNRREEEGMEVMAEL